MKAVESFVVADSLNEFAMMGDELNCVLCCRWHGRTPAKALCGRLKFGKQTTGTTVTCADCLTIEVTKNPGSQQTCTKDSGSCVAMPVRED